MDNIEQRVKQVVADQLGVEVDSIKNESSFVDDLGADSLDMVELIMAFEDKLDVKISDADAEKITTVQHALDFIANKNTP